MMEETSSEAEANSSNNTQVPTPGTTLKNSLNSYLKRNKGNIRKFWIALLFFVIFLVTMFIQLVGINNYQNMTTLIDVKLLSLIVFITLLSFILLGKAMGTIWRNKNDVLHLEKSGFCDELNELRSKYSRAEFQSVLETVFNVSNTLLDQKNLKGLRIRLKIRWINSNANELAYHPRSANALNYSQRHLVSDDYEGRNTLLFFEKLLLFSGIVLTFYGLYIVFSEGGLQELVQKAIRNEDISGSIQEILSGLKFAFASSGSGYIAYLWGQYLRRIADRNSEEFAILLDEDLTDAWRHSIVHLAAQQPLVLPDNIADTLNEPLDAIGATIKAQAQNIKEQTKSLEDITAATSSMKEAAAMLQAAADTLCGTCETVTEANFSWATTTNTFVGKADSLITQFDESNKNLKTQTETILTKLNAFWEEMIKKKVSETNKQVDEFNEALKKFNAGLNEKADGLADFNGKLNVFTGHIQTSYNQLIEVAQTGQIQNSQISKAMQSYNETIQSLNTSLNEIPKIKVISDSLSQSQQNQFNNLTNQLEGISASLQTIANFEDNEGSS